MRLQHSAEVVRQTAGLLRKEERKNLYQDASATRTVHSITHSTAYREHIEQHTVPEWLDLRAIVLR